MKIYVKNTRLYKKLMTGMEVIPATTTQYDSPDGATIGFKKEYNGLSATVIIKIHKENRVPTFIKLSKYNIKSNDWNWTIEGGLCLEDLNIISSTMKNIDIIIKQNLIELEVTEEV